MSKNNEANVLPTPMRRAVTGSITARAGGVSAELRVDDLLYRVRNEYLEMPGLRLTLEQAQRLWHLRRSECEALLRVLVDTGFLARTSAGAFVRVGSGRAGA